ncbi:MAG: GNAT family N-acetyltransferase [Pseudomonadota bacterium]
MAETLRRLGPADEAAAQDLIRAAFARYAAELGRAPSPEGWRDLPRALDPATGLALGLERDGRLLAGAFLEKGEDGAWDLARLAADPGAPRGLGAVALDAAIAALREAGARRLTLSTATHMTGVLRLYRSRGFAVERTGPPSDHGDPHERSYLALALDQPAQS